jgi:uncharacterized protein YjiS (DUF1127 family)
MRNFNELQNEARRFAGESFGRVGRRGALTQVPPSRQGSANDAVYLGPAAGGVAGASDAFELGRAARAARAGRIGSLLFAAWRALATGVLRIGAQAVRRRHERATFKSLCEFDAHTLRDIGLERSETGSVATRPNGLDAISRVQLLSARFGR